METAGKDGYMHLGGAALRWCSLGLNSVYSHMPQGRNVRAPNPATGARMVGNRCIQICLAIADAWGCIGDTE